MSKSQNGPKKGSIIGDGWVIVRHSRRGLWMAICPECGELITDRLKFFEKNTGCLQCTPKNLANRVQQVESGRVYSTARAAAQINGFSEESIRVAIRSGNAAPDGCYYTWVEKPAISIPKTTASNPVENIETGLVYPSVIIAAKMTGVNPSQMSRLVRGRGSDRDGNHWQMTSKEVNVEVPENVLELKPIKREEPKTYIVGQSLKNGWIVRSDRIRGVYDLECPSCQGIVVGDPASVQQQKSCRKCYGYNRMPVEKVETGEVYPSMKGAAIANGLSPATLSRHIKKGKPLAGFHWAYSAKESNMP